MQENDGLVCAYDFDGHGGGQALSWDDLAASPAGPLRWVHLDRGGAGARRWLAEESRLDEIAQRALLAEDTRPRCTVFEDGVLLILRGVNQNPGADPGDLVSLRLWIAPGRVVSARRQRVMAVNDIESAIQAGRAPGNVGAFVARLAAGMTERMEPAIDGLDDELGELEEQMVEQPDMRLRHSLGELRRRAITLRRYIASQREALAHLIAARPAWLQEEDREKLNEQLDRVTRYVEDLDALRERGFVLQDELTTQLSDRMNRIIYVLTVLTGVFLPITFFTGLLGINVGGVPGMDDSDAFWVVCAAVAVVAVGELIWLRYLKWI